MVLASSIVLSVSGTNPRILTTDLNFIHFVSDSSEDDVTLLLVCATWSARRSEPAKVVRLQNRRAVQQTFLSTKGVIMDSLLGCIAILSMVVVCTSFGRLTTSLLTSLAGFTYLWTRNNEGIVRKTCNMTCLFLPQILLVQNVAQRPSHTTS